jgi:hypothetical protein
MTCCDFAAAFMHGTCVSRWHMAVSENKGAAAVVGTHAAGSPRMSERFQLLQEQGLAEFEARCRLSPSPFQCISLAGALWCCALRSLPSCLRTLPAPLSPCPSPTLSPPLSAPLSASFSASLCLSLPLASSLSRALLARLPSLSLLLERALSLPPQGCCGWKRL